MKEEGIKRAAHTIAHHSKSFSLASALLPRTARHEVWLLYHWCRRADDMIDHSDPAMHGGLIAHLQRELALIYEGERLADPTLAAFQDVVLRREVPQYYGDELIAGLAMDSRHVTYATFDDLLLYCYRVAGTVGLMMAHVLGVRDPDALRQACDLGVAMQLTNICRDVLEDWNRGRLYLPLDRVHDNGGAGIESHLGGPLPETYRDALARTVRDLLDEADIFYRRADDGMKALPWRCAFAVRTARLVYAAIATDLQRRNFDVFGGRAFVSKAGKIRRVFSAALYAVGELPYRIAHRFQSAAIPELLTFERYSLNNGVLHSAQEALARRKAGFDG